MKAFGFFLMAALVTASVPSMPAEAGPRWVVLVLSDMGTKSKQTFRIEVDQAPTLEECRIKAARAYAKVHGPIFCQHIDRAFLVDVYGNANPIYQ
jgi:hypothetical protein